MTDKSKTSPHWAYRLPAIIDPKRGPIYWAPEAISEHAHPEYWAAMWGYSELEINAAKKAQNV
jgi:hypothetical protein